MKTLDAIKPYTFLLILCLAGGIFVLDVVTPVGYAVWLLYIFPILLTYWGMEKEYLAPVTILSTGLVVLGFLLSPKGGALQISILNRGLGIVALWILLVLLLHGKREEQRLKESETKYRDLIEQARDAILVVDPNGKILLANSRACQMLGYSRRELLSLSIADTYPAEQRSVATERMAMAKNSDRLSYERSMVRKDGTVFPVDVTISVLPNGMIQGSVRDITERKQSEEALYLANQRLTAIIQASPLGIISYDPNGYIRSWNFAAEKTFGWSESEVLGRLAPHIREADLPEFHSLRQRVVQGELLHAMELKRQKKDGTQIVISLNTAPTYNPSGQLDGYIAIIEDITERKRTEEALRESEAEFRSLAESSPLGIVVSLPNSDILYVNPALLKMTGLTHSEFVGAGWLQAVHPEDRAEVIRNLGEVVTQTGKRVFEHRMQLPSGEVLWVVAHAAPVLGPDGRVLRLVGTVVDITERNRVREELRESELRFRSVWEKATDGMRITNEEGIVVLVNDAYCKMVGKSRADIEGKPMSAVYEEARQAEVLRKHQERFRSRNIPAYLERELVLWNGKRIFLELSNTFLEIPHQQTLSLSVFRDITERKRVEEALRREQEFTRAVLDSVPGLLYLYDERLRLVRWNKQHENVTGYSTKELSGRYMLDWFREPDRTRIDRAAQYALLKGTARGEAGLVMKDGSTIPHYFTGIRAAIAGQTYIAGIAVDVTERKRVEEALRESEKKYRELVDNLSDVIFEINPRAEITFVNPAIRHVLGYEPDEIVGKSVFDLIYEGDRNFLLKRLGELKQGIEYPLEYRIMSKSGDVRWIRTWSKPIKEGNTFLGARGTLVDITERKRAEETIREARERLEALSHRLLEVQETERRHISRELHDEIGQALTALKINLQTIGQDTNTQSRAARAKESVAIVDRTIEQVRNLTVELRPSLLDDFGLAPALRWYVDRTAQRAGIKAHITAEGMGTRLPAEIETACFRAAQEAITNVVRHANAKSLELRLQRAEKELVLTVRDDGKGFDVQRARKEAIRGASLGLLGMQERVTIVGGTLEINSSPGRGTEVVARFPCPSKKAGNVRRT